MRTRNLRNIAVLLSTTTHFLGPYELRSYMRNLLELDLTGHKVDDALQNITLSVMYALHMWHTTTNVTQTTYHKIFSFSSRPRLITPYAISLLATLSLLFLGFRSLRLDGVPAVDGGFIQPLVTIAVSTGL
jgi:hypothetical protein